MPRSASSATGIRYADMPKTGSVVRMNNIRRTYVVTYITTYNLYGMILDSTRYEEDHFTLT